MGYLHYYDIIFSEADERDNVCAPKATRLLDKRAGFSCRIDNGFDIWYNYTVDGIHGISVTKDGVTTEYVFRKNFRGDVTHIYKQKINMLSLAARYKYDAWGNCEVEEVDGSGIGAINPIRYRSYFFDTETGLYYLNARYYDPEVGRFISADDTKFLNPDAVNGLNLFVYCANNPVMNVDPSGRSFMALLLGVLLGTLIGGVGGGISSVASGGDFWSGFLGGMVSGFISSIGFGLAITTGGVGGLIIAGVFGFGASFFGSVVQQGVSKGWGNIDWMSATVSGIIGMAIGIVTYGFNNFVMRESVGLFNDIFDKSISFGKRFINSLSISLPSFIGTICFVLPFNIYQTIIESIVGYIRNEQSSYNSMRRNA